MFLFGVTRGHNCSQTNLMLPLKMGQLTKRASLICQFILKSIKGLNTKHNRGHKDNLFWNVLVAIIAKVL